MCLGSRGRIMLTGACLVWRPRFSSKPILPGLKNAIRAGATPRLWVAQRADRFQIAASLVLLIGAGLFRAACKKLMPPISALTPVRRCSHR